ncbi:Target SNARE coiled-coil homology domain, partial [Babesia duncani]
MDRSYDFKRTGIYWKTVLQIDTETLHHGDTLGSVDRFSILSSAVFTQLQLLEAITEPYEFKYNAIPGSKTISNGELYVKRHPNVIKYMQTKREAFNKVGIANIVHDTQVVGELIQQLKDGVSKEISKCKDNNQSVSDYRNGVIQCLSYLFQIVRNNVQEYERFRLKTESFAKAALKVMNENLTRPREIKIDRNDSDAANFTIPRSYLNHFIKYTPETPSETSEVPDDIDESYNVPKEKSQELPPVANHANFNVPKSNVQRLYQTLDPSLDLEGSNRDEQSQVLVMQHERLMTRIQDEMHTLELNTINNVQQRLAEISSMFEKFTGTLAEQLDMFENINANVRESLSNIATSETHLKKKQEEGLSHFQ